MINKRRGFAQNKNRRFENFVANFLSCLFMYQNQNPEQDDTSAVGTPAPWMCKYYQQYLKYRGGPSIATT